MGRGEERMSVVTSAFELGRADTFWRAFLLALES
jgi:hypothetical protein